jgi:hypothetical protein
MVALALSVTLVFLLFDAAHHMTFGAFFVARMWQGKVLLLMIVVPLLLALLHDYAERPSLRRLALLGLAGVAGVGLSTTAIFVIPVIALGSLAAVAWGSAASLRRAAAGMLAVAAYPVGAGAVTKLAGGRTPDHYTLADVVPANLVHYVLGTGGFALLGVSAVLVAPSLLRRRTAAMMVAGTVLLVGLLVSPGVPARIFELTGLGRVLWRLTWALPVAALVGALATGLLPRNRPVWLRALPALLLCAAMALWGEPLWSVAAGTRVAGHPVLKRSRPEVQDARAILARVRPGDVILAREGLSQTLLVMSGDVTTVSPRGFFTTAMAAFPAAHAPERRRLERFAMHGVQHPLGSPAARRERRVVRADLRIVGVDLACVRASRKPMRGVVLAAGYEPAITTPYTVCLRARAGSR